MRVCPKLWKLSLPILVLGGAIPLLAQGPVITSLQVSQTFEEAPDPNLPNAITAGSNFAFTLYINGTFNTSSTITVTWTDTSAVPPTSQVFAPQGFGFNQIIVTIPPAAYATVVNPTQPDNIQVTVTQTPFGAGPPNPSTSNPAGFIVNPPTQAVPVIYGTIGLPFPSATLFQYGTPPYQIGFEVPPTLPSGVSLPATGNMLTGTPGQTGEFDINYFAVDVWGQGYPLANVVEIEPVPQISVLSPGGAAVGSSGASVTVFGANLVGPGLSATEVPLAGSTVQWTSSSSYTILTPVSYSPNSLTFNVPGSLLTTLGTATVSVLNPAGTASNGLPFLITTPQLQLITFGLLPTGTVGTAYSTTCTATGGTAPYSFVTTVGRPPAGLALSSSGVLSGIPTAYGTFLFTVQVTDSVGATAAVDYTLTINPGPLSITSAATATKPQGSPMNIQFTATGGAPPYTFVEIGALPPGTQLASSGALTGTPTTVGTYPFQLFVDDSIGKSASQNVIITITAPVLAITTASPLPSGQVGVPYSTQLAAIGGKAPYSWSATGLPGTLTIANSSGLITGIPSSDGTFTVTVTLADSNNVSVTQNYSLAIAPVPLQITTGTLPNGAVGSSYTASLAASGGDPPYAFTANGLPQGLKLATSGAFSGAPTTTGTFTISVTVTDSKSLTATASFTVTIATQLVVTSTTVSNGVVGTALSVKLAATGGTPPYQWQTSSPPPGLSLAADGTLSGTPTTQGTFSVPVVVVDSNGASATGTVKVTVALPVGPTVSINGLSDTNAPATQPTISVVLGSPYPVNITAVLTLTFAPDTGPDDPNVQFASGGRTAQIVVLAGTTGGVTNVGLQTGTVAGTITITAQLMAGGQNVTPSPAPTRTVRVNATAPVITSISATRNSTGFTVVIVGYASSRGVTGATFQFSASAGATLQTSQLTIDVTSLFTQWFQNAASAPTGSQFMFTQPFNVSGSTSSILSVTATLTSGLGTSAPATANLQ